MLLDGKILSHIVGILLSYIHTSILNVITYYAIIIYSVMFYFYHFISCWFQNFPSFVCIQHFDIYCTCRFNMYVIWSCTIKLNSNMCIADLHVYTYHYLVQWDFFYNSFLKFMHRLYILYVYIVDTKLLHLYIFMKYLLYNLYDYSRFMHSFHFCIWTIFFLTNYTIWSHPFLYTCII
jgi:hypothetical protein